MLAHNIIVQTMTVPRLRRELKTLKGFEPQADWMRDRIKQIEAELRVRKSLSATRTGR